MHFKIGISMSELNVYPVSNAEKYVTRAVSREHNYKQQGFPGTLLSKS